MRSNSIHRMHNLKRLLILLGTGACLAGCSEGARQESAPTHNVFTIHLITVGTSAELTFPAVIEETSTAAVGFKTAGQIQKIYVKEGQRVSKGQVLARLDTTDYALGISTLREKYRQMAVENERRAQLHATGNMSDNDYENAVSGLTQLGLQLRLEENKLAYCTLRAPASGVITAVNFEPSEMVDAGTPVFELMDNSRLEVVVDLPLRHYAERGRFERFTAESPLIDEPVALEILSLTPRTDNTQLYRLRLAPQTAVDGLTPGMNVTVRIHCGGDAGDTVNIPLSALFERNGEQYVWTVNPADSVISARRVSVEGLPREDCVKVSGISDSDIIVRSGVHHLTQGEKVNIIS